VTGSNFLVRIVPRWVLGHVKMWGERAIGRVRKKEPVDHFLWVCDFLYSRGHAGPLVIMEVGQ
jgi:hypothetical protein